MQNVLRRKNIYFDEESEICSFGSVLCFMDYSGSFDMQYVYRVSERFGPVRNFFNFFISLR